MAGAWANIARVLVGLYFIGGALFNAVFTYPAATAVYEAFADLSWPVFEALVRQVVLPLAQPVTLLVIVFEFVVGILVLSRGRWTRPGIQAAVLWHVVLVPFLSFYAIANVVLAAAIALLLRRDFGARAKASDRVALVTRPGRRTLAVRAVRGRADRGSSRARPRHGGERT